jgi:short-subunit dehydrogenase
LINFELGVLGECSLRNTGIINQNIQVALKLDCFFGDGRNGFVMGILGVPYRSAYCASKHALKGFFDTLRAEVHASNIQVTNILPGYVRTNVTINALKGDGSPNDEMAESTAGGYSPTYFAQKVQRAIARKKKEVYIAKTEILGIYIMRFFPNLFFRIIRNHRLH